MSALSADSLFAGVTATSTALYLLVTYLLFRSQRLEGRRQACLDLWQMVDQNRPDRKAIRDARLRKNPNWSSMAKSRPDLIGAFDRVARTFDVVGAFDRIGMADRRFIDVFFAATLEDLWSLHHLGEYVQWIRINRGRTHYWELLEFRERVRGISLVHPATTGKRDWPRNPRRAAHRRWPKLQPAT